MSASLIGRSGSSAFRLSTTTVSMSLTGSRFSSESDQALLGIEGGEVCCRAPLHCRAEENFTLASVLTIASVRAPTFLVNFLRTQIAVDVRTYRPEKYYMRGPGPKWREKHGQSPAALGQLGSPELWNAGV